MQTPEETRDARNGTQDIVRHENFEGQPWLLQSQPREDAAAGMRHGGASHAQSPSERGSKWREGGK